MFKKSWVQAAKEWRSKSTIRGFGNIGTESPLKPIVSDYCDVMRAIPASKSG